MRKKTQSRGNFIGIILALIVLTVGVIITIAIPIIGWVIKSLLILLALTWARSGRRFAMQDVPGGDSAMVWSFHAPAACHRAELEKTCS
jgi:hypothetical protein